MIPAVTSTSAAGTSTAAARHASTDEAAVPAASPAPAPASAVPEPQAAAKVTISEQASVQAAAQPVKPDWTYQAADGNKDGKVTVFEQQVYDFRHYPSSLEKAKAYGETGEEPKPDAGLTA